MIGKYLMTLATSAILSAPMLAQQPPAPPAGWTDGYVKANGIRIHYWRSGGNKPPLVMAHGSSDDGLCWTNLAKELTDKFDVVLPDARGHGLSDPPSQAEPADVQVEDLAGLIQALNLEKPILMGHSMGSSSVAWLAARYPDIPQAVVLEDPRLVARPRSSPGVRDTSSIDKRVASILKRNNMNYQELVENCLEKNPQWGRSECQYWAPSKQRHHPNSAYPITSDRLPMSELFPKITCPTLILKADAEGDLRLANEKVASLLKQGKIVHVQGAKHNVGRDQKERLLKALVPFLEAQGSDEPAPKDASGSHQPITWDLWPGKPPGEIKELAAEYDTTKPTDELIAGRRLMRITNVAVPQLAIHKPDPSIDTGTSVVIAPGGGHWILAYDLEGTEVAEWFNSIGVTAIVLKYRVPGRDRNPDKPWLAAAQDGQRAISLVRGRANEIGIDPDRIGILGFSAGGSPVKYTALTTQRLYEPVDDYDKNSFRPDFAAPIYSGGLPADLKPSEDCPPVFMVIAHDDEDRSIGMAELYIALKKANVSAELHVYESGGHGYGLRKTELPVTSWPDRMEEWMTRLKLLEAKH